MEVETSQAFLAWAPILVFFGLCALIFAAIFFTFRFLSSLVNRPTLRDISDIRQSVQRIESRLLDS